MLKFVSIKKNANNAQMSDSHKNVIILFNFLNTKSIVISLPVYGVHKYFYNNIKLSIYRERQILKNISIYRERQML